MAEAQPQKSRAAVLRDKMEAEAGINRDPATQRPLRKKLKISYLDGTEVEVPFWSNGDYFKAERKFEKALALIVLEATGEMFLSYCALQRHTDGDQRPTLPFERWVDTVDQLWDFGEEEPDPKA